MVLNHLKSQPLTPLVALKKYGTLRLAALIFNLRDEGYNIKTDIVNVGTKRNTRYVAQYSLLKNKN